jgi:hypothetical protein
MTSAQNAYGDSSEVGSVLAVVDDQEVQQNPEQNLALVLEVVQDHEIQQNPEQISQAPNTEDGVER